MENLEHSSTPIQSRSENWTFEIQIHFKTGHFEGRNVEWLTIRKPNKTTIRKPDHFISILLSTIRKPDMSDFWIPTVLRENF